MNEDLRELAQTAYRAGVIAAVQVVLEGHPLPVTGEELEELEDAALARSRAAHPDLEWLREPASRG